MRSCSRFPPCSAAGFFELYKTLGSSPASSPSARPRVATGIAFIVGLGVIAFLMSWISKHSFLPFVIYRVAVGTLVLVLLATGVIQP